MATPEGVPPVGGCGTCGREQCFAAAPDSTCAEQASCYRLGCERLRVRVARLVRQRGALKSKLAAGPAARDRQWAEAVRAVLGPGAVAILASEAAQEDPKLRDLAALLASVEREGGAR